MQVKTNMPSPLFFQSKRINKQGLKMVFKSKKHEWLPKEKELISKYRKGLIWKDL